jgi:hypothetical protein
LADGWVTDLKQVTKRRVGLEEGDDTNCGRQHADGRTIRQGRVWSWEEIAEVEVVRCFIGEDGQVTFILVHRGVDERFTEQVTCIADEVLGEGMVATFNYEVSDFDEGFCVASFKVAFVGADAGARVE